MPDFVTSADFSMYDLQMSRKIGQINDGVDALREQVNNLTTAFVAYVAETDVFRIQTSNRLDGIDTRLDGIDTRLDGIDTRLDGIDTRLNGLETRLDGIDTRLGKLEQVVNQGFALLFARLGIQP